MLVARIAWLWIVAAGMGQVSAAGELPVAPSTPPESVEVADIDLSNLLAQVPSDAAALLVAPRIDRFDERLGELIATCGLGPGMSIQRYLQSTLELVAGLEPQGPVAVALLGVGAPGETAQRLLLIVPTSDPTALMTFLSPSPEDAQVTRVRLRGRDSFASVRGRFVLFGPDRASVTGTGAGGFAEQMTSDQHKALADSDLTLLVTRRAVSAAGWDRSDAAQVSAALGLAANEKPDRPAYWSARLHADGIAFRWLRSGRGVGETEVECVDPQFLVGDSAEAQYALWVEATLNEEGGPSDVIGRVLLGAAKELSLLTEEQAQLLVERTSVLMRHVCQFRLAVSALGGTNKYADWTVEVRTRRNATNAVAELETWVGSLAELSLQEPRLNEMITRLEMRRGLEQVEGRSIGELVVGSGDRLSGSEASTGEQKEGPATTKVLARWAVLGDNMVLITDGNQRFLDAIIRRWRGAAETRRQAETQSAPRDSRVRLAIRVQPRRLRRVMQLAADTYGTPAADGRFWNLNGVLEGVLERTASGNDEFRLFMPGQLLAGVWGASVAPSTGGTERPVSDRR